MAGGRNKKCETGDSRDLRANILKCIKKDEDGNTKCDCDNKDICKDCTKERCNSDGYSDYQMQDGTDTIKTKRNQAHHIILKGDMVEWPIDSDEVEMLDELQEKLNTLRDWEKGEGKEASNGVDSCANGVCLPYGYHQIGIHLGEGNKKDSNMAYIRELAKRFENAETGPGIKNVMDNIKQEMSNGTFEIENSVINYIIP